jgi:hypothetical protein
VEKELKKKRVELRVRQDKVEDLIQAQEALKQKAIK